MKENEQLRAEIELLKETVTNLRKEADNGSNLPRTPENIKYLKSIHGKEEASHFLFSYNAYYLFELFFRVLLKNYLLY